MMPGAIKNVVPPPSYRPAPAVAVGAALRDCHLVVLYRTLPLLLAGDHLGEAPHRRQPRAELHPLPVDFQPIPDHWEEMFGSQRKSTERHFRNSLVSAIGSTLLSVIIGAMAGYGLSRFRYYLGASGLGQRQYRFLDHIAAIFCRRRYLSCLSCCLYNFFGLVDTYAGVDPRLHDVQYPFRGLDHARLF